MVRSSRDEVSSVAVFGCALLLTACFDPEIELAETSSSGPPSADADDDDDDDDDDNDDDDDDNDDDATTTPSADATSDDIVVETSTDSAVIGTTFAASETDDTTTDSGVPDTSSTSGMDGSSSEDSSDSASSSCIENCHPDAICLEGECVCMGGFTGDGIDCQAATSCANDPCFEGVECTDLADGFSCGACPPGTEGDGLNCTDIDGCADSPCYPGVPCSDAPAPGSGYTCGNCPTGREGDGITCTDIDGCAGDPCFAGVACHDAAAPNTGFSCDSCPRGYTGNGQNCSPIDECANGSHHCGNWSGACTSGAGLGYNCECATGFTDSGGEFPQCYLSGRWSLNYSAGVTFDADTGDANSCCQAGDFYISSIATSQEEFYANNVGQRGLMRVNELSSTSLLNVAIPTAGYTRFGVEIVQNATYVSYAQEQEGDFYVVFRITSLTSTNMTIDYVYVYRP